MEDSKYIMEYDTPTLLSPKYRYAIVRGASGDNVEYTGDLCVGNDADSNY